MVGETTLEINLSALKNNFDILRAKINKNTMLLAVVKAFAYGSDAVKIAQFLEELGVNYFAVAYVNEGVLLRKSGIKTPILVLHPQPINFELLIKFNLEPSLYSFNALRAFIEVANANSKENFPGFIHLVYPLTFFMYRFYYKKKFVSIFLVILILPLLLLFLI